MQPKIPHIFILSWGYVYWFEKRDRDRQERESMRERERAISCLLYTPGPGMEYTTFCVFNQLSHQKFVYDLWCYIKYKEHILPRVRLPLQSGVEKWAHTIIHILSLKFFLILRKWADISNNSCWDEQVWYACDSLLHVAVPCRMLPDMAPFSAPRPTQAPHSWSLCHGTSHGVRFRDELTMSVSTNSLAILF